MRCIAPIVSPLRSCKLLRCCWQGNYKNGGIFWLVYCITFWLLYSYMVPISLFVTMEIVKLFQVSTAAAPHALP